MDKERIIVYRIDAEHKITFVNEHWDQIALQNNAPELSAESILKQSLWSFIGDDVTRNIYRQIFEKIRSDKNFVFQFRCDSPDCRRFMEMNISSCANDEIQFEIRTLKTENRPAENVLSGEPTKSDEFIRVCSWCKKVDVGQEDWREIEEAVKILGIFEKDGLPQLTHGMCLNCYEQIRERMSLKKSN